MDDIGYNEMASLIVIYGTGEGQTEKVPDAPTSGDVEFTDCAEVEAFTADVAAFVEGRLGVAPPESGDAYR